MGQLTGNSPALDIHSLPLYQKVKEALAKPLFMPKGGYIGIYCTHAYPHTTKVGQDSLPGILKGADMAVYTIFRALGLKILVKTVLDDDEANASIAQWHPSQASPCHSRIGDWGTINLTSRGGDDMDSWNEILHGFAHRKVQINWLTGRQEKYRSEGFVHLTVSLSSGRYHEIY